MMTRNILIAEPVSLLADELRSYIDERNFSTLRANSLKETLLTLQNQRVDVLLMDAALLGKDCGFISIIKGIKDDLPIIVCADINTPEFEGNVRKQRIFFYHIKSFGTQDLEMAISDAVNKLSS
jgi:DNA-binding NtrC family response regulator